MSEKSLRNLLSLGRGPKKFKQGRLNAFYAADLDAWLAGRITDPDAPVSSG